MSNYPNGADTPSAPWNQEELPEKEVEVMISLTISTITKVKVSDYTYEDAGTDEDGNFYENINYENCDLKKAVLEQIIGKEDNLRIPEKWDVDDFEVMLN